MCRQGPDDPHRVPALPGGEVSQAEGGVLSDLLAEGDGMHQTVTMDIGWMIEGELGVEMDDGSVEWLTARGPCRAERHPAQVA